MHIRSPHFSHSETGFDIKTDTSEALSPPAPDSAASVAVPQDKLQNTSLEPAAGLAPRRLRLVSSRNQAIRPARHDPKTVIYIVSAKRF